MAHVSIREAGMRLRGGALQKISGLAIVLLGSLVLLGWVLREPTLVRIGPDWVAMVANTAACFVALGAVLLLSNASPAAVRVRRSLGSAASLLALGVLVEALFGVNLGLDWPRLHAWLDDGNQWPGRMAPNTSLGFLFAGLVIAFGDYTRNKQQAFFGQLAILLVLLLGLTGWVGYSLQLELLFSGLQATRMALPTAVGMTVLGVGLAANHSAPWNAGRSFFREDERIVLVGGALLAVIALTTAVTGFASQQKTLDRVLSDTLPSALRSRIELSRSRSRSTMSSPRPSPPRPDRGCSG